MCEDVALTTKSNGQRLRQLLEKLCLMDACRGMGTVVDPVLGPQLALPVIEKACQILDKYRCDDSVSQYKIDDIKFTLSSASLPPSKGRQILTPKARMESSLRELCENLAVPWTEELLCDLPNHWEVHRDLAMVPTNCLRAPVWSTLGRPVWTAVAAALGCTRLARRAAITDNDYRSPQVELLLGDDGWVTHTDNGIRYSYDVRWCMFSSGNVTEKLRVAAMDCRGETVVDLYAGIGYFTLPYLVHAGAAQVYACEWNPHAAAALQQNVAQNGCEKRCVILQGDNRQTCPKAVADRVNLGLIPSSEAGWGVACSALRPLTGGILHIHATLPTSKAVSTAAEGNGSVVTTGTDCDSSVIVCNKHESVHGGKTHTRDGEIYSNSLYIPDDFEDSKPEPSLVNKLCTSSKSLDHSQDGSSSEIKPYYSPDGSTRGCECRKFFTGLATSLSQDKYTALHREDFESLHNCVQQPNISESSSLHSNGPVKSQTSKFHKKCGMRAEWCLWVSETATRLVALLEEAHGTRWHCEPWHVECVKSYAPHIQHVVLDIECRPVILGD